MILCTAISNDVTVKWHIRCTRPYLQVMAPEKPIDEDGAGLPRF
jgi:hypothetical protein